MADVAVIATGVIGRSWLRVFTRAGCNVRAWDPNAATLRAALEWHTHVASHVADSDDPIAEPSRIVACDSLAEAVEGVSYVQESGPESLVAKRAIYRDLDRHAGPDAILASSTSALDMTEIAEGLAGAERCVVAHPVNPPHVVPVVEVVGGARTAAEVVARTEALLLSVGQTPVRLNYHVPGFLLNRMQAALVREAVDLVARGVASVDAVDAVIRDGLGLRWAFFGPFATADTNADLGARSYFERFGSSYEALWQDLSTDVHFDSTFLDRVERETAAMTAGTTFAQRREWRDRAVTALRALKARLAADV